MSKKIAIQLFQDEKYIKTLFFERDLIKIGRLASAQLTLDDKHVSRIHAVLEVYGQVSLIDMGSAVGTLLNGQKVSREFLKNGDEIKLGSSLLKMILDPQAIEEEEFRVASIVQPIDLPNFEGSDDEETLVADLPMGLEINTMMADLSMPNVPPSVPVELNSDSNQEAIEGLISFNNGNTDKQYAAGPEIVENSVNNFMPVQIEEDVPFITPKETHNKKADISSAHIQKLHQEVVDYGQQNAFVTEKAAPIDASNRYVEVTQRWLGQIQDIKRLRDEKDFSIGASYNADLFVPLNSQREAAYKILVNQNGSWFVRLEPTMKGVLRREGVEKNLQDLALSEIRIDDDVEIFIDFDHVSLTIKSVSKSAVVPYIQYTDTMFLNLSVVMMFLFLTAITVFTYMPTDLDKSDEDLMADMNDFKSFMVEKEKKKKNEFLERFQKKKKSQSQAASGKNSKAGTKKKTKDKGRMATKKKKDEPTNDKIVSSKMAALFGKSGKSGLQEIFGETSGGSMEAALGGVSGAKTGASAGSGGLGVSGNVGSGAGGKGAQTVGIGKVGTTGLGTGANDYGSVGTGKLGKKANRKVKISVGPIVTVGSLDKKIIKRVVDSHKAQIRYCYNKELVKNPKLAGKINVKWVIKADGKVSTANIAGTTMRNKNVENCLTRKVRTWRFPKPKGGGIVVVNYPFLFASGK